MINHQIVTFRLWAVIFILRGSLASWLMNQVQDSMAQVFLIAAAAVSLIGASLMLWTAERLMMK